MKMAQPPPDQNYYHPHPHANPHPQLQLPPQFRNPFDLIFDERTGAINYNYIRPYIPKPDDLSDSMVMRRPRRTRTTFTAPQISQLEQHFLQGRYLTTSRLAELSAKLGLGTAQVKIWFKNRRRRQKIQSDQHKGFPSDAMPLSPASTSNSIKSETNGSASSCGSQSSRSSSSPVGPPDLKSLSLNGSDGSTPNALTPSPTPTTPTANLVTHYGGSAFNPYYYNNHPASHPSHHHHQTHVSLTHPYAAASTQYYPPPPPPGSMQHHPHQQQYHATHPHQFPMQHKAQATSMKQDTEYNFDNPYYMPMTTSLTANSATTTVHPTTSMSPNSEDYEPLTAKNCKSSSLCNGVGSEHGDLVDDSNETKIKLRVRDSTNGNDNGDTCSRRNPIPIESCATPAIDIMDDCNGTFSKFQKIASDTSDPNYQCTMDTLMHAYNNRNNSTNTQQLATYCFN